MQLLQINHSLPQFLEREKMVDSEMRGHILHGVGTYYNFACEWITIVISDKPLPTLIPGERGNDCTCSEATVIAVSAVSLLLIVTLTTVSLTQCLLIIRMRRSRDRSETYAETTNSTTKTTDVPVSLNEAYGMTKITTEEVTYEVVK